MINFSRTSELLTVVEEGELIDRERERESCIDLIELHPVILPMPRRQAP